MTFIQQRDAQSVLAGIDELLPQLRDRAQATEDLRRIRDETVQQMDEVGFFKLPQPEQWGGLQSDPRCSTRRCAGLLVPAARPVGCRRSSVCTWHLALFDQQAQEEVWGDDPTLVALK